MIESRLRLHVRNEDTKAILALLAGIPLCFLAPLILGSALWMAVLFGAGKWTPWWWWFGGVALFGIPSLFRLELRTRGRYLEEALADAEPVSSGELNFLRGASLLYGAHWGLLGSVSGGANGAAGFVEIFLSGPRLVLYGLRRLRARQRDRELDLGRAAEVVATALGRVGGVQPEALLKVGERMPELVPVLQWLACNRWIGVTESGNSVYLFTERRKRLESSD